MARKSATYAPTKGMNQDLDISKFSPDFLYYGYNIRINHIDNMWSITNTEGNEKITFRFGDGINTYDGMTDIPGIVIGYCTANYFITLFVDNNGYLDIYRIYPQDPNGDIDTFTSVTENYNIEWLKIDLIAHINEIEEFNWTPGKLVDAFGIYENEDTIKVYFIVYGNAPMVINISPSVNNSINNNPPLLDPNSLRFWPNLNLQETVNVVKMSHGGQFHSGTVQWAFTYWNKNGAETNIFYTTPLWYTSFDTRGGSPEEICDCSFSITVNNLQPGFDFVRAYCIMQTTLDGTPLVRNVGDFSYTGTTLNFFDGGTQGSFLGDYTQLLYIGGEELIADTWTIKDNVLFAGNLSTVRPKLDSTQLDNILNLQPGEQSPWITWVPPATSVIPTNNVSASNVYSAFPDLTQNPIRGFKYQENYRFGIQAQYKTGQWSEVVWIGDSVNPYPVLFDKPLVTGNGTDSHTVSYSYPEVDLPQGVIDYINSLEGYINIRLVYSPLLTNRTRLAQGVFTGTIFYVGGRGFNLPFGYTDYFARGQRAIPGGSNFGYNQSQPGGAYFNTGNVAGYVVGGEGNEISRTTTSHTTTDDEIANPPVSPVITTYETFDDVGNKVTITTTTTTTIENGTTTITVVVTTSGIIVQDGTPPTGAQFGSMPIFQGHFGPLVRWVNWGPISGATIGSSAFHGIQFLGRTNNTHTDREAGMGLGLWEMGTGWFHNSGGNISSNIPSEMDTLDGVNATLSGDWGNPTTFTLDSDYPDTSFVNPVNSLIRATARNIDGKGPKSRLYSWWIDNNLVNLWSPELEFYDSVPIGTNVDILGAAYLSASQSSTSVLDNIGVKLGFTCTYADNPAANFSFPCFTLDMNGDKTINENLGDGGPKIYAQYAGWETYSAWSPNGPLSTWWFQRNPPPQSTDYLYVFTTSYKKISRFMYLGWTNTLVNTMMFEPNPMKYTQVTDTITTLVTDPVDFEGSIVYNCHPDETQDAIIGMWANSQANPSIITHISYNCNRHAAFTLPRENINGNARSMILPSIENTTYNPSNAKPYNGFTSPWYRQIAGSTLMYEGVTKQLSDFTIPKDVYGLNHDSTGYNNPYTYFWVGDIIRNIDKGQYGEDDINSLSLLTFIPCSDPTPIGNKIECTYNNGTGGSYVWGGDTFYQRYDTMRIWQDTNNTDNLINEVVSVPLETFTNLDYRWDSHRGELNVSDYDNTIYKVNTVYNQSNDFFTYNVMNPLLTSVDLEQYFTWSKPKIEGEFIDNYTKLNLVRSYPVNMIYGRFNKLTFFQNELYGFQDRGIFNILYNQRVQIPASDNTPIEVSTSQAVQGIRYITNEVGVQDKWAFTQTSRNIYFVDYLRKSMWSMAAGSQLNEVSYTLFMNSWFKKNVEYQKQFILEGADMDKSCFIVANNNMRNMVYVNNLNYSLKLNELLGLYECFMPYKNAYIMFNYGTNFLTSKSGGNITNLWAEDLGDYGNFYGVNEPSIIEYYMNPEPQSDKVFDNLQYRMDVFDADNNLIYMPKETFSELRVANEFQRGIKKLNLQMDDLYLSKKFRIWNTPFPRAQELKNGQWVPSMNRIRNTWAKVKLTFNKERQPQNYKFVLSDLKLSYTI